MLSFTLVLKLNIATRNCNYLKLVFSNNFVIFKIQIGNRAVTSNLHSRRFFAKN